jgi:hypothetical protein
MSDSQTDGCAERLSRDGLTPVCPDAAYDVWMETTVWHETCVEKGPNEPIEVMGCFNSRTQEWRFELPERLPETCRQLSEQDPDWQLAACFCCCGGPD